MWRAQRALAVIPAVAIGAAMCLWPHLAGAQTTGSVRGFVRSRGEPQRAIANADVLIKGATAVRTVRTDAQGFFIVWDLPPGRYAFGAIKDEYNPAWSSICVHAGGNQYINIPLSQSLGGFYSQPYSMRFRPDPSQTVDLYSLGDC